MFNTIEKHYNENKDQYLKLAKRYTKGDASSSEDIVQEAYYRALKYSDSYNPELSDINTWFSSIFRSCIKAYHREKRNSKGMVDLEEHHISTEPDLLESQRSFDDYKKIFEDLRGDRGNICYLYFIRNYKNREICKVLDLKRHYVNNVVSYMKKKLKEYSGEKS